MNAYRHYIIGNLGIRAKISKPLQEVSFKRFSRRHFLQFLTCTICTYTVSIKLSRQKITIVEYRYRCVYKYAVIVYYPCARAIYIYMYMTKKKSVISVFYLQKFITIHFKYCMLITKKKKIKCIIISMLQIQNNELY